MFAVIRTGGKQYRVAAGEWIDIEKLDVDEGGQVSFDDVLLVGESSSIVVGTPTVSGATVTGTVVRQAKGPKIDIFKYRRRKNYRRKTGHRQPYTRVQITGITAGAARPASAPPPRPAPPPIPGAGKGSV